jgi:mono/diheme cytochrome c family protein
MVSWLLCTATLVAQDDELARSYDRELKPFLQQHCFECHGTETQESGLNFTSFQDLPSLLSQRELWRKISEAVEQGDMPPQAAAKEIPAAERKRVTQWIATRMTQVDRASSIYLDPGPPVIRMFTRAEYNNTLRDLLGFPFDAAGAAGIPQEDVPEGFTNLAGGQVIDDLLLDKYFAAAEAALTALFEEANRKSQRAAILFVQPSADVPAKQAALQVLARFARRAFRRPVSEANLSRYVSIAETAMAKGDSFELAIRKALKPMLVSPQFLFRLEREQSGAEAYRVNDHELAVRLSYFLWSTMPDAELSQLADEGKLSEREVLVSQVKRMLADKKAEALTEHFAMQWLQLMKLRRALPSRNHFPAFTPSLKNAMEQETRTYFDKLRSQDRSVLELLDADYTYVNEELAKHYGLAEVKGNQMQRVTLKPEDHRGGLLGMASILTLTSHTDRTKPTARGKWILDVLLGTPPSPPPANVSNFKPPAKDQPAPKNFREKLAQHASDATCAGCHKKIDPLGFSLENFDAIGSWREQLGDEKIDNAGRLPDGTEFRGVADLKKIIQSRQPLFLRNLAGQMLAYSLGRNLTYTDELTLVQIRETLAQEEYRFSTLVREIVLSRPFQYRKNMPAAK